jgi:uncharacterized protein (DUF697 family)/tellurite resistance protein
MDEQEQKAVLTIALMAAFADGAKDERERAQLKSIADSLAAGSGLGLAGLYQDVLLKRRSLAETAAALQAQEARQLAYEMAVCVCDADGTHNAAETRFLEELRVALGLDPVQAEAYTGAADALAEVPLDEAAEGPLVAAQPVQDAKLDRMVLNYSILNGALELLPQSLATMAIVPLQMKMVYRIGRAHGYELDRGHIKDLLATLGVGLTSQYVEEFGRKLLGGLLKKVGGGLAGALGRQAAGSAMSFATTYALGQVAKQYYSGGRSLDVQKLKAAFQSLLGEAQSLRGRYAGQIEQKARTLDVNQLLTLVRQQ